MRAGALRHRIRLQTPVGSRDAVGERLTTWTDAGSVWAHVEPLHGQDKFIAAQTQASTSHKVTVRYDTVTAAVQPKDRVMFRTRVLVIDSIVNPDERNISREFFCTEGLGPGG